MNSSLQRFCNSRAHFIHVSKELKTIQFELGTIKFKRTIIDPKPGTARYTSKAAWERCGRRGMLYAVS